MTTYWNRQRPGQPAWLSVAMLVGWMALVALVIFQRRSGASQSPPQRASLAVWSPSSTLVITQLSAGGPLVISESAANASNALPVFRLPRKSTLNLGDMGEVEVPGAGWVETPISPELLDLNFKPALRSEESN